MCNIRYKQNDSEFKDRPSHHDREGVLRVANGWSSILAKVSYNYESEVDIVKSKRYRESESTRAENFGARTGWIWMRVNGILVARMQFTPIGAPSPLNFSRPLVRDSLWPRVPLLLKDRIIREPGHSVPRLRNHLQSQHRPQGMLSRG